MSKFMLSKAMGAVPDDMLQEATEIKKERRTPSRVRRAAAMAAVVALFLTALYFWPGGGDDIISMPGVMKVYACELDNVELENVDHFELTESRNYYQMVTNPAVSARFVLPLTLQIPDDYFGDMKVTFEITSDYASFFQNIRLENGESIMLDSEALVETMHSIYADVGDGGDFYLDIFIYADGKIAGYGVIAFCFCGSISYVYEFSTVCYPVVDGRLQEISKEYVLEEIKAYKQGKIYGAGAAYIRQKQEEFLEKKAIVE